MSALSPTKTGKAVLRKSIPSITWTENRTTIKRNREHHVEVLDLFDMPKGARLPVFIDGKWRTPAEDVGGAPGSEMFLEAMADPSHDEHENLLEWFGKPSDPHDI